MPCGIVGKFQDLFCLSSQLIKPHWRPVLEPAYIEGSGGRGHKFQQLLGQTWLKYLLQPELIFDTFIIIEFSLWNKNVDTQSLEVIKYLTLLPLTQKLELKAQ